MLNFILKILFEFIIIGSAIAFVIYFPEIFPKCFLCGKIKFRKCFSLHRDISLSLGRRGSKWVCKKCCRKHDISTLADADKKKELKKRAEYKTRYTL